MKKCLCFLLAAVLLSGCGVKTPSQTDGTAQTVPTAPSSQPTAPTTVPTEPSAPTEPTEPPVLHTVWFWTQQTVTDAEGNSGGTYTRSYDKKGNILTDIYASADGRAAYNEAYTYDDNGRMLTHASYDSHSATGKAEFFYDAQGKLVTEQYANNEGYSAKTDYTYGGSGELVSKLTVTGKTEDRTTYVYNEKGHLSREEQIIRSGTKVVLTYLVEHTYDENGNRLTKKETQNAVLNRLEEWTYNAVGQVLTHKVTDGRGIVLEEVKYLYFSDGKLDQETFYKGGQPDAANYYIYDDAGRVIKKAIGTPYEKFIDVSRYILYTYDEHGNLLAEITTDKNGKEISRREYTYISMEIPVK